jgi:hypothetical protein
MRKAFACLLGLLIAGCGTDRLPEGTARFASREFKFEISISDELARAGWIIVRAQDATFTHAYVLPDSSVGEAVAVVAPPARTFPGLAPIFVDVSQLQSASATPKELGDLRAGQVGESLLSQRPLVINGVQAEEVAVLREDDGVAYETFLTRGGMAYSVNVLGAMDTSPTGAEFLVDTDVYREVAQSFRFTE